MIYYVSNKSLNLCDVQGCTQVWQMAPSGEPKVCWQHRMIQLGVLHESE